jgi:DNA-binding MarR family transcriptional regulator
MTTRGERRAPERDVSALHAGQVYSAWLTACTDAALATLEVTNQEIAILLLLRRRSPLRPSAIADELDLTRAAVSRSLARLHRADLVSSSVDADDRRARVVSLTPVGRRRLRRLETALGDFFIESHVMARDFVRELGGGRPLAGVRSPLAIADAMAEAGEASTATSAGIARRAGMTAVVERFALVAVCHHGHLRPRDLVDLFGLSRSQATEVLQRLDGLALVKRLPDAEAGDRRSVAYGSTAKGCRVAGRLADALEECAPAIAAAVATAAAYGRSAAAGQG